MKKVIDLKQKSIDLVINFPLSKDDEIEFVTGINLYIPYVLKIENLSYYGIIQIDQKYSFQSCGVDIFGTIYSKQKNVITLNNHAVPISEELQKVLSKNPGDP